MILMNRFPRQSEWTNSAFFQNVLLGVAMICPMTLVYQEMGPQNWWVPMQAWRVSHSVTADMKMPSALVFLLAQSSSSTLPFIPLYPFV